MPTELCAKCKLKPAMLGEDRCEDCWADAANRWMWRGPHDDKPRSDSMLDRLDCNVLGVSRRRLREMYSSGILRKPRKD